MSSVCNQGYVIKQLWVFLRAIFEKVGFGHGMSQILWWSWSKSRYFIYCFYVFHCVEV